MAEKAVLNAISSPASSTRPITKTNPSLQFNLGSSGYGSTAMQTPYIAAGSSQLLSSPSYSTQAPYVNPEQQKYYNLPAGSTTTSAITQPNPITKPNTYMTVNPATGTNQQTVTVPSSSQEGSSDWAKKILSDMNSGKINWDDNLRSKANAVLNPSSGGPDTTPISREDVAGAYRDVFGEDASSEKLNAMMEAWGGQTRDRARALAEEQYRVETEAAERGYGDTMGQLRVQKGEVGTLGQQQRERIAKEKEMGTAELETRRASQEKEIGEQSEKFGKQMKGERETLARNWRDMSMELQRIMRARGVQDSSYSADKEARAMSEFNLGLNKLAETSQEAFKDFADAVIETNAFYKAEQNKLDFNAQQAQQDVDNWVRQRVQDIQAQEKVALSKKLNEINSALAKANQLKASVEQKIADQKMNMDTWLYQTMTNYKNAVSLAAQGKVQSAQTSVKDAFALSTAIGQQLSNKMATIREVPGTTGQYQVYGQLPTGQTDEYGNLITVPYSVPATAEQYQKYNNPSVTDQILNTVQGQQTDNGGILGAIGSWFK